MRKTNKSDIKNNTKAPTRDEAFLHKAGGEAKAKTNLFESITDKIIQVIEAGEATGSISWAGQGGASGMPVNLKTGKAYNGVNVLLLWAMAQEKGYTSPYWLTFNQAKEMGGNVKKGEKATQGIFWGSREIIEEDDNGDETSRNAGFAKAFYVFNLDQVEGIENPLALPSGNQWNPLEQAEALIKASGARIIEGGTRAYYSLNADEIHMPDRERFASPENFYAVNLHELTHWTGHTSRCNRDLRNRFGDEAYAMEELIAELGAAFLSSSTGINGQIEGHACYIKSWLKVLKNDKRAIVTAASKASQAAQFLIQGAEQVQAAA